MPLYEYFNKKTKEVFTEYLPVKDRNKPLKDKNVEMVLHAPRLGMIDRKEHKARDQILNTARQGMKQRQIEDSVGIRKTPEWLQERTEKKLQKIRNVSS
jgi:hypothetical protein|tara:strand:- start:646 stop:942 length:297 start_codon:yes stop_codon:yes gene_type:complete